MASQNSAYEQILGLLPALTQADRMLLLEQLQPQVQAIDSTPRSLAEFQQRINAAFGIWADRTDLPDDSSTYVRQLRNAWNERLMRA
ncbi:MAG: hypothetical protein DMF60_21840 [Acidobacteria bacterium]|nr:MAG: hypothetical protein DMF60_21840 [Acidobacteriota bacterium]